MNYIFIPILKYIPLFILWFLGIYITLFAMCFYVHVNESNIIANKADALINQITHTKTSLVKVSSIQNMTRKTKPIFLEPYTVILSLIGKREPYKLINKLLGNAIENGKPELAGLELGQVDLEAADVSNADMHGVNLEKANLSGANLSGSNLIAAKLRLANLRGATLFNTNLYKADFRNTILNGANFEHAQGITCEQIKSAVINEYTRFPSYISMKGSTKSVFKCVNFLKGMGMDLSRINLDNAYLRGADFSKSILSHANFMNTTLAHSNFNSANLSKANLKGANLSEADFNGAKLTGADLTGADLNSAASITCEQIKSGVIDENTRLPDYISLSGSPDSAYKCENTLYKN